jgi:hypothetical protein
MDRLVSYRLAMLAAFPDVPREKLTGVMNTAGPGFINFVVEHGLGPVWHERTGREEFRPARRQAEALFLAHQEALKEIDAILEASGIEYAVIKGAANRLLLFDNPAVRACHDIDVLVAPGDRVAAAKALDAAGFRAEFDAASISRELVMIRGSANIDLHWALLREGRLRVDPTAEMLSRRRRSNGLWMLDADDAFYLLLVHPAFGKHLSSWNMGLHRVADVIQWINTQSMDWSRVCDQLRATGVQTAAWATMSWIRMLAQTHAPEVLNTMSADIRPGRMRCRWIERWLRRDLSVRLARRNWIRLLAFSIYLHDRPGDALRAIGGRFTAHRRVAADLDAFNGLTSQ